MTLRDDRQRLARMEQLAKASDVVVECLAYMTARAEAGEAFTPTQIAGAQRAIAVWKRMRYRVDAP